MQTQKIKTNIDKAQYILFDTAFCDGGDDTIYNDPKLQSLPGMDANMLCNMITKSLSESELNQCAKAYDEKDYDAWVTLYVEFRDRLINTL